MIRNMSVNGTFYPNSKEELERYFIHFSTSYDKHFKLPKLSSRVIIAPHAGYIYSGFSANVAYRILKSYGVKKIVVIGPSHRVAFDGISLCDFSQYATPFGDIQSDTDLMRRLKDSFSLKCIKDAHYEHSTEVNFPFIKYYLENVQMVELVYGRCLAENLSKIIDTVLEDKNCALVISTDLSHFYDLQTANTLDLICRDAIKSLDIQKLHSGCEACGIIGVEAMMISAKKMGLEYVELDYRTSADASGDDSSVVGYLSACFI